MSVEHVKPLLQAPSHNALVTETLHHLVKVASMEVLAQDIVRRPAILEQFDAGTEVFIPFPPNGTWDETLAACRLLLAEGCQPVPHIPARRLRDRAQLVEWAASLAALNVTSVLLIAGDVAGEDAEFKDSLDVLEAKLLAEHGIDQVSVAAYPDGHPHIPAKALEDALIRKLELASDNGVRLRVVTQFGFDAAPILEWFAKMNARGVSVPVSVGIAGPSKMRTLLTYAAKCGVRHSIKGLLAKPSIVRMLGQWDPLEVLSPIAEYVASGTVSSVEKAHIFTFGGLRRTLEWRDQVLKSDEVRTLAVPDE